MLQDEGLNSDDESSGSSHESDVSSKPDISSVALSVTEVRNVCLTSQVSMVLTESHWRLLLCSTPAV